MAYKNGVDKNPIKGKNWTLWFEINESTGGVTEGDKGERASWGGWSGSGGKNVNFTCASAVMWNINFTRNSDGYSAYGHPGGSPVPKEERYELYAKLVEKFKVNTFMVTMVGVVNGGTAARARHYLQSENKHNYHTHDFANYLIAEGIGVVVESPVFVNTFHKWEGPSICQGWMWFSPSIMEEGALLRHTGDIYGLDKHDKFLEDVKEFREGVPTFDDMLSPNIVNESRFAKAAEYWNKAMEKLGIKPAEKVNPKAKTKWKKAG